MRYIAFLGLAAALALSCVSCSERKPSEPEEKQVPYNIGILLTGKPFAFRDERGELTGLEPELMRRIAEEEGIIVVLKECGSLEEIHNGIIDGTLDGGLGRLEREELPEDAPYCYSDSYLSTFLSVLVPAKTDLEKLADLEGRRVGVQQGTRADEVVSAREGVFVRRFERGSQAVEALLNGDLEAVVMGNRSAEEFLKRHEDQLDELEDTLAMVNYAMLVRRDERTLPWCFGSQVMRLRGIGFLNELREKYDQDFLDEAK